MAVAGHVDAISRAGVEGWLAAAPEGAPTPQIVVLVNGQERIAAPVGERRGERALFRFAFDPPLSPFREWRIEVLEAAGRERLPGGLHIVPRPTRDGPAALAPVVVTSAGRSGTTLLMAEFARHPGLVVADRYPYEIKQISYFASAFRALAANADRARSAHPDTMLLPEKQFVAGSNPYNHPGFYSLAGNRAPLAQFYESRVPARLASTFRELILEFYAILRDGQRKPAAAQFCEKLDLDEAARQAVRLFFPRVREIVLVRDPRDLLASARAFWKLNAKAGWRVLEQALPRLLQIERNPAADVLVVRYEDLLGEPAATRQAIGRFIGVTLPPDLSAPDDKAMAAHRTSGEEPLASIGRWRRDVNAEQVAAVEATFSDYMRAFDYAPDHAPAKAAAPKAEPPAPPGPPSGGPRVVAEGAAVGKLRAAAADTTADGRPMRPVLRMEFGSGHSGAAQLGQGWSQPEQGYVWSDAPTAQVILPPLREPGSHRLWLAGLPLLHPERLQRQTVTILVNDTEIGSVSLRALSVVAFDLPAIAVGSPIALTLRLPDATRPSDLGTGHDDRQLGIALRWAALLRAEVAPAQS